MSIATLINKPLQAKQFKRFYKDNLENLDFNLIAYPTSILYSHLNENTIVAVNLKKYSQNEFYTEYEKSSFILDSSLHPRKLTIQDNEKVIFYVKPLIENIVDSKYWAKFTINIFKLKDEISGAIEHGNFSPMMVDQAFEKIEKLLKKMRLFHNTETFKEETYGSTFIEVKFLNEEPYYDIEFLSKGLSFKELNNILGLIYKDIPYNKK